MIADSRVLLTLLLLLALSADVGKAVDCTGIADGTVIKEKLDDLLAGKAGEGDTPNAAISQFNFTCRVQGTTMGTYQQLSVVVEYTNAGADNPNDVNIRQYELKCIEVNSNKLWESVAGSLSGLLTVDIDALNTTQSCSACDATNGDTDTHCVACPSECNTGLMRCTGPSADDCCVVFEDNGECSPDTNCDTPNFVANQNNSFLCSCGVTCGAGETFDAATCSCNVTNICLASEPCENYETCTVGADPVTDYTCNCSGNFMGNNCSVCGLTCDSAGYGANAVCTECIVTVICEADDPCENGGTCTVGDNPATNYTCDCSGTGYSGINCTVLECSLNCTAGYIANSDCTGCVLNDTCIASSPCQNGGLCTLGSSPDQYTCDCTGTNYNGTDCSNCSLKCDEGYLPDKDCEKCITRTDICEAFSPCQNGATCMTRSSGLFDYTCLCTNYFTGQNCTNCSLECLNDGTVDRTCRSCDCVAGYTGRNCSECATGYSLSRDDSTCNPETRSSNEPDVVWWHIFVPVIIAALLIVILITVIILFIIFYKKRQTSKVV